MINKSEQLILEKCKNKNKYYEDYHVGYAAAMLDLYKSYKMQYGQDIANQAIESVLQVPTIGTNLLHMIYKEEGIDIDDCTTWNGYEAS